MKIWLYSLPRWRLILEWSKLSVYHHNLLGIAKLTCPIAEMSSIATLRDCHVQSIKFWIKLTYKRSILINPVGLWKIENGVNVFNPFCFLTPPLENGLKLWSSETGIKRPIFYIFSTDVFEYDSSVTEWPGSCWPRVQTSTMLLSGFFSFV